MATKNMKIDPKKGNHKKNNKKNEMEKKYSIQIFIKQIKF